MTTPLVIAIHGTRVPEGQAVGRRFTDRVRGLLPGVSVADAYVELDEPPIADAVAAALTASPGRRCVVVPLMVGVGGHVLDDIPEAIAAGVAAAGGGDVALAAHLGPDARLRAAVLERAASVSGEWDPSDTALVFLGRGCSVTAANADHARLTRVVGEEGGYGLAVPAYIQVVRPHLGDALAQAYAVGFRRIVVQPNYLFPGRLQRWAVQQAEAWASKHPDATVRLADVIGDCDALAEVVVDRYRAAAGRVATQDTPDGRVAMQDTPDGRVATKERVDAVAGRVAKRVETTRDAGSPVYLTGLDLRGRRVLVAGAGRVAARRIPTLLAAGAEVVVVAPEASPAVEALAAAGRLAWHRRPVAASDVQDAWYVLAATSDPDANELVGTAAAAQRIFCVRADAAASGTARTPATAAVEGLTVGVIGDRDCRLSAKARDAAAAAVAQMSG